MRPIFHHSVGNGSKSHFGRPQGKLPHRSDRKGRIFDICFWGGCPDNVHNQRHWGWDTDGSDPPRVLPISLPRRRYISHHVGDLPSWVSYISSGWLEDCANHILARECVATLQAKDSIGIQRRFPFAVFLGVIQFSGAASPTSPSVLTGIRMRQAFLPTASAPLCFL